MTPAVIAAAVEVSDDEQVVVVRLLSVVMTVIGCVTVAVTPGHPYQGKIFSHYLLQRPSLFFLV